MVKATVKKVVKKVVKKSVKASAKAVKKTAAKPLVKKAVKKIAKPVPKAKKVVAKKIAKKKVVVKVVAKVTKKATTKAAVKVAKPAKKLAPKLVVANVTTKKIPLMVAKTAAQAIARPMLVKAPVLPAAPVRNPIKLKPYHGAQLTEQEVIKQSKNDYMNSAQLAFFRQRLLDLQIELRSNAGMTTEHLRDISVAPDPADRATQEEEHALELRTRDRERKLLKKVESTMMRIDDGSYGYCEETGDPIGIQRLLARPTATLTIEAQERRELKQKMYGE